MSLIRKPAPQFKATAWFDSEFIEVDINNYKGKYVLLFFYPLDFTFVCPTEIIAFNNKAKEFREIGCEVLGCSVDSKFSHM
jgi:alkyl hydroperoxide reductase subunit AhpC